MAGGAGCLFQKNSVIPGVMSPVLCRKPAQMDKQDKNHEQKEKTEGEGWGALKKLLPYIWPKDAPELRARVVLAVIALLIAKLMTIAAPMAYKAAVDHLTPAAGAGSLSTRAVLVVPVFLILAYGFSRVGMIVFNQLRDVFFVKVGQHAVRTLSRMSFEHMLRLSLRFHLERHTGGISRVIERGTKGVELVIRMGLLNSVPTVVELSLITALLVYTLGWVFVWVILLTVVVYFVFTVKASEWRTTIRRKMNEADNESMSKAVDSLLNYETIKYFGNEKREISRFDKAREAYEQAGIKTYMSLGLLNAGQSIIFTTGLVTCMLLAGQGVVAGTLTIGDFVMVNALLIQLYQPLNFMGTVYREIRQALVDLENMFALLERRPEVVDRPDATVLQVDKAHIRFDNVTFSYDARRPILKGVSFEVPPGRMVAFVGPSGAGKSTISRLLFRFYDVQDGAITIDGQNIADVTQQSLRKAIGMVPQDTVLFNDTIFYNIQYGNLDSTAEEVYAAAKMAQIHEFIESLPNGYETQVGERGLKLSGGEKQRVAIARTILKRPPILMLDEATSALDSHTEKEIQASLDEVARNRTSLVIAHRLSTIVHADEIIVLEKGRVVEKGNHRELMARNGLYAGMWARQREAEEARQKLASVLEEGELEGKDRLPLA